MGTRRAATGNRIDDPAPKHRKRREEMVDNIFKAVAETDELRLIEKLNELLDKLDPQNLRVYPEYPGDRASAERQREYIEAVYATRRAMLEAEKQLVELDRIAEIDDPCMSSEQWEEAWNTCSDELVVWYARTALRSCGTGLRINLLNALGAWLSKQGNPEGWRNWPQLASWLRS